MSLQITRIFEAPREKVFGWWSDGDSMQQWSGCKDCTRCRIDMDFRGGGGFTQRMQLGDKGEYTITYERIVAPELIVYRTDLGVAMTRVTIEFHEHGSGTEVVLTQEGLPGGVRDIVAQGTRESFARLEPLLAVPR